MTASRDRATTHFGEWRYTVGLENRRRNIKQAKSFHRGAAPPILEVLAVGHGENSMPVVICAVRASVVITRVDIAAAYHSARTPVQIVEKDTEVGCDVASLTIGFIGQNRSRP